MSINIDERSLSFINQIKGLKESFWEEGYIIIPEVFDADEIKVLKETIVSNADMNKLHADVKRKYDNGKYPSFESIFVMNDVFGDDIFSKVTRNHKLLDIVTYLFDDDAYVYHNKVVLKYQKMPGFKYHQDYFYWYKMGCLYPNMASCFIAVDEATRENGCLKFIPGSHKYLD
jgi:ectoine hydroxylase-related dioxygenase (phytanoyl-CoA dioxygenase family)